MRKKEQRIIITFHTTAEAMAAEKALKKTGISGRLIPVPRQLSSGCGLAWSSGTEEGNRIAEAFGKGRLSFEAMGEYLI